MPGSSISPSTSTTRPTGLEYSDGGSVSSTATTWPAVALAMPFLGMRMSWPMRRSSGATSQMPDCQQQTTDERSLLAIDDLQHLALGPATLVQPDHFHAQAVTMHDGVRLLG